jgi:hypothetical protein
MIMIPTARWRRRLRASALVVGTVLASPMAGAPLQAAPAVKRVKVKNGRTIRVVLGDRREPASGVRPDKDGWVVVMAPDVARSSASLQDITPGVPGSRWVLPVAMDRLVLDAERFLPSHVYRMELRRDGQVLGSALVYLYPPPAERVGRADFRNDSDSDGADSSTPLTTVPKGELSR